jgi:hypothetical protein
VSQEDVTARAKRKNAEFWARIGDYERRHPGTVVAQDTPLGVEGDALWAMLTEELGARIALGQLGKIEPTLGEIHATAYWLAEAVTWSYRVERRPKAEIRERSRGSART